MSLTSTEHGPKSLNQASVYSHAGPNRLRVAFTTSFSQLGLDQKYHRFSQRRSGEFAPIRPFRCSPTTILREYDHPLTQPTPARYFLSDSRYEDPRHALCCQLLCYYILRSRPYLGWLMITRVTSISSFCMRLVPLQNYPCLEQSRASR